jgi:uncharacterized membrane protein HdeD (DUF308 family)
MVDNAGRISTLGADIRGLCKRSWWVFLIGGIAAVVFGIIAFLNPPAALLVIALFFAAAVLVDGVVNVWGAVTNREKDGWWILLLLGVLGVLVGGYALFNPPVAIGAFVYLVAFMAIFLGVFTLLLGYRIRQTTEREWILYLTGGLSVLFGVLIAFNPFAGSVSVVWMIATWAIVIGALRIAFALKVRKFADNVATRLDRGATAETRPLV